jgi:hypothetical protein
MAFPVSIDGSVEVKVKVPFNVATETDAALDALVAGLDRVKATSIKRHEAQIVFTVGFVRLVWNTNLLVGIEGGTIHVEPAEGAVRVTYRLGIVCSLVAISALALFALVVSRSLQTGGLAWAVLFGFKYLVTALRFRWFVKDSIRDACEHWAKIAKVA